MRTNQLHYSKRLITNMIGKVLPSGNSADTTDGNVTTDKLTELKNVT